jgi:hypothetical protein
VAGIAIGVKLLAVLAFKAVPQLPCGILSDVDGGFFLIEKPLSRFGSKLCHLENRWDAIMIGLGLSTIVT